MNLLRTDIRHPDLHEGQLAVLKCEQKRRIVIGANHWGYTTAGILDVLWCARGRHPWRVVEPSPSQFWVCVHSYRVHDRVHWSFFDGCCPTSWIARRNKKKHFVDIKRIDGGTCRIWFRSTNPNSWRVLESRTEVNGVWIDGPPREDHFDMAMRRVGNCGGWTMLTFTPTNSRDWWWYDRIWDDAKARHDEYRLREMDLGPDDWWTYQARLATRNTGNRREYEVGRVLVPHYRRGYDPITREYVANGDCQCEEAGTCKACRERTVAFAKGLFDPRERGIRIFGEILPPKGDLPRQ